MADEMDGRGAPAAVSSGQEEPLDRERETQREACYFW